MIGVTRNVMNGAKQPLPEWEDWGTLFKDGLSLFIIQLVYTLPFWLLACIAFFATVGFSGVSELSEEAAGAGLVATFGLVGCLTFLFAIALFFLSPAIVIQYVRTNDLAACFRFGEVLAIARENVGNILIAFLASFGASMVVSLAGAIPCLGFIVIIAASPWLLVATGHMYGQIAAGKAAGYAEF